MLLEEEKSVNKSSQRGALLDYIELPEIQMWKRAVLLAIGNVFSLSVIAVIVLFVLKFASHPDPENAADYICYSILFIALIAVVIPDIPKIGKILKRWEPYIVGIAIGMTVLILDNAYINVINLFYPVTTSGNEEAVRKAIDAFPVASVFIFGLIGPMCEELTYRSGLFGLLKRWHRIPAYIITGLVFGFIHFQYDSTDLLKEFLFLPTYVVPGLLFSLAYDLYGLPCSYIAHMFNNTYAVLGHIIITRLG